MRYFDFHSHILPGMDDGAKDAVMSAHMLAALKRQGVTRVAATSHYIPHRESPEEYLARRSKAYEFLQRIPGFEELPKVYLGAEIYLEKGISDRNLTSLCLEGTNLLMVEFPREPFKDWMTYELENLAYTLPVKLMIAHIDRYYHWYKPEEMDAILQLPAVFQINAEAFEEKHTQKIVLSLAEQGYPLVLGSDAHNETGRAPNFDLIEKKVKKSKLQDFYRAVAQTIHDLGLD